MESEKALHKPAAMAPPLKNLLLQALDTAMQDQQKRDKRTLLTIDRKSKKSKKDTSAYTANSLLHPLRTSGWLQHLAVALETKPLRVEREVSAPQNVF